MYRLLDFSLTDVGSEIREILVRSVFSLECFTWRTVFFRFERRRGLLDVTLMCLSSDATATAGLGQCFFGYALLTLLPTFLL